MSATCQPPELDLDLDALVGRTRRLTSGRVAAVFPDLARVELDGPAGGFGLLPVSGWPANKQAQLVAGARITALADTTGPIMQLSVTDVGLVTALLDTYSPDVRSGTVRVMAAARIPGVRSKVAVAAVEGADVDPVAACLGRGAWRVKAISAQLSGERVDIVAWHPDPAVLAANALGTTVIGVHVDESAITVTVPEHLVRAAIGPAGANSKLAADLCERAVTVVAG